MSLFGLEEATKVFLYARPADIRKGFDGLYGLVLEEMSLSAPAAAAQTLHRRCPCCKKGKLITLENFDGRGPPTWVLGGAKKLFSCSVN